MPGKIFINYRRGDNSGFVQALLGRLEQVFSREQLFIDIDGIEPGVDFVRVLEEQVAQCDVLLAVIGKSWTDARDETNARRLDNPADFVRIEITSALSQEKRVIPVLVGDARMPRSDELPAVLKPLATRGAVRLTHERFRADTVGLIGALQTVLSKLQAERDAQEAKRQEAERLEAARQESERQEAASREAARQEAKRQEAERLETARQESERQEAASREAAKQEAKRQEAERLEAARQKSERQEAASREAAKQEAKRQEAERLEAARQESERRARRVADRINSLPRESPGNMQPAAPPAQAPAKDDGLHSRLRWFFVFFVTSGVCLALLATIWLLNGSNLQSPNSPVPTVLEGPTVPEVPTVLEKFRLA